MIVYGDAETIERPADVLRDVAVRLAAASERPAGIERHADLVAALIRTGELLQGLADANPPESGRTFAALGAVEHLLARLASAVVASWDDGFAAGPAPSPAEAERIAEVVPGEPVRIRQPEGYAFYALYPESIAAAARRLPPGRWRVVGIRSIGTGLAAVAAAALGAESWTTVRPTGHPFARRIEAAPAFTAAVAHGADRIAVVDEGPGLSGSSFGAVADWLEAAGVPRDRIAFLPSHGGDLGPEASDRHRARWRTALRPVATLDDLILSGAGPGRGLLAWTADLVHAPGRGGPALRDIGGGAWRALHYRGTEDWPAAFRQQERRKFLRGDDRSPVLVKFAGLGAIGESKFAMQRDLAEAGFAVPPLGVRHGFLAEPWIAGARPGPAPAPDDLVDRLSSYLAHRDRRFPAGRSGADLSALSDMARQNLTEAGLDGAALVEPFAGDLPRLQAAVRPVAVDGRLHPHEWIETPDGRILKTDAVDHHAAHDLVGCQDVAWDVAGAAVEFHLAGDACEDLRARVARRAGHPVDRRLVAFMTLAYAAFQLGRSTFAAADSDPAEAARHQADVARYRTVTAGISQDVTG
jgi:hypothetical protein